MFFVCYFKKRQSTHAAYRLNILWPLLVTSFISLTSSRPSFLASTSLPNKATNMNKCNRLAGMIDRAEGPLDPRKQHGYILNSRTEPHSYHNNAMTTLRGKEEKTSYSWDSYLFSYQVHAFWKKRDPMGRELKRIGLREQVEDLELELPALQKGLEENRSELQECLNSEKTKTAYEILSSFLKGIEGLISQFTNGRNMKGRKIGSADEILMKQSWKTLVLDYNGKFEELVNLMFNSRFKPNLQLASKEGLQAKLRSQIFSVINILAKYNLFEEKKIEDWINTEDGITVLSQHLEESCNPENHLFFDLQESFSKSKASEHIGFILTLLKEDSWKFIEHEYLRAKREAAVVSGGVSIQEKIIQIWDAFRDLEYGRDTLHIFHERAKVFRDMIEYFGKPSLIKDSEEIIDYHRYDLLYGMMNFSMKHHNKVFMKVIQGGRTPEITFAKIQLFEEAINCFKDARELAFMIRSGLWTTEIEASESRYLIKLKEVSITKLEEIPLGKDFGLYFEEDKDIWAERFRKDALQRNKGMRKLVYNVAETCESPLINQKFGTNFFLKNGNYKDSSEENMKPEKGKKVSKLFLSEISSWVSVLDDLQIKLDLKERNLSKQINILFLSKGMKESKEVQTSKLSHLGIMSFIIQQINKTVIEAKQTRDLILKRLVALKNEIKLSN